MDCDAPFYLRDLSEIDEDESTGSFLRAMADELNEICAMETVISNEQDDALTSLASSISTLASNTAFSAPRSQVYDHRATVGHVQKLAVSTMFGGQLPAFAYQSALRVGAATPQKYPEIHEDLPSISP